MLTAECLSSLEAQDEGILRSLIQSELAEIASELPNQIRSTLDTAIAGFEAADRIAVAIATDQETAEDFVCKVDSLLSNGAAVVWAVFPMLESLFVFDGSSIRRLRHQDTLEAPSLLPGFKLPIARLFPD